MLYTFYDDKDKRDDIAFGSQPESKYGLLVTDFGIVGSASWFEALQDRKIPVRHVCGTLLSPNPRLPGESGKLRVKSSGEEFAWPLCFDVSKQLIGRNVRVTDTSVSFKNNSFGFRATRLVIHVELV